MKDYELRDLLTRIARRALDAELDVGVDRKALQRAMNELFEDVETVMSAIFIQEFTPRGIAPRTAYKIYTLEAIVRSSPSKEFLDTLDREVTEDTMALALRLNTQYKDQVFFKVGHEE